MLHSSLVTHGCLSIDTVHKYWTRTHVRTYVT